MKKKIFLFTAISLCLHSAVAFPQTVANYLILQDIGVYQPDQPKKHLPGEPPWGGPRVGDGTGIVGGSHFSDHIDRTYELKYFGGGGNASPTVTVTQHANSESNKWLLHEIEIGYRDSDNARLGLLHKGAYIDKINNSVFMGLGIGGNSYRWLSANNVVVSIKYADPEFTKPEPVEIIKAYLAKFPSIIPMTFKLTKAHEIEWIKDEMDRRLWLSDKWALRSPTDDVTYKILKEITDHISVFLDYREKYFGISARDEKLQLFDYYEKRDNASIKNKLQQYKDWWAANKSTPIYL